MNKRLQELREREMRICEAVIVKAEELLAIRDNQLYQECRCTWEEYLRERHNMSKSTFKSLQASAKMYQRMEAEFGVQLGNKSAARELRRIFHRDSGLAAIVVQKAQQRAGMNAAITGAHVKAVEETLKTVLLTHGLCDDGDGGMMAFDAQIDAEFTEILMRQKQHAIDGAKANGWSRPMQCEYGYSPIILDEPGREPIPVGATIELKWRVIEPEKVQQV